MSDTHPPGLVAAGSRLGQLLAAAGQPTLTDRQTGQFEAYLSLLRKWNARVNLTAIRDAEGILSRHFVESIVCARALPQGIANLLDLGSGAGFPGIPVAICRPEIAVTLAESQCKKSAFLQEAVRTLGLEAQVHAGRAEDLGQKFDCVTLRAVDRMEQAVRVAAGLVRPGGWLALMTTQAELAAVKAAAGDGFDWQEPVPLPGSGQRIVVLAHLLDK
ncbi:MAG: 16S rRNA (guanine(527)-N(7))-methyltransferase RsmG [Acidobacteriota bacterium]|nr:16S rRNA (guanine(527)-N(7))-methyltransferase RsmG [Acidobacteriota bacterium]